MVTTSLMTQQHHQQEQQQQQQKLSEEIIYNENKMKFQRKRKLPLQKDETGSAEFIDKSSLRKLNNNYKFVLCLGYTLIE